MLMARYSSFQISSWSILGTEPLNVLHGVKYPEHVSIPNLFLVGKSYGLVVQRPPFVVSSPEHLWNLSASLAALPIDEPRVGRLKQA
jgi:hypothetical protein